VNVRALLLIVVSAALSTTAQAQADPEVGIAALPDWVEELQLEEFSTDRSGQFQQGIAYLLSDRQVRKTSDGYDYFDRLAYEVIDRSGLESSARIAPLFDPVDETLSFNFVRVIRNGEVIDRLTDAEITLLRQEEGLDSSLIDGLITALIQLEDVRIGDVIDYSYSGSVASKLWPDDIFEIASTEWSVPLAQMHFNLMVPEDLFVEARGISTDIAPKITLNGGWKSLKLHVRDTDPVNPEQNIPDDWTTYGFVVFSTMESWSDIVDWAVPLFTFDEPLPADFVEKLDGIADAYSHPEDRATHALRLIQADIRYLGFQIGLGSHVPRSPTVTLELGYGDCKDKSVLLVSALNYLGIDAVPALASTTGGDLLPQFPPTIGGFDHMIVEFDIDGRKFWVDPTLSHQGGKAETFANLGYGYVLPIRHDQSQLVKLDEPLPDTPVSEIIETFEFPETGDTGLRVSIEYTYRSYQADNMRFQISSAGQESMTRSFLDYYAANYEGLTESLPLTITDDMDENVVVFRAEYEMDASTFDQSDYGDSLPVLGTGVQDILPRQVEAKRIAPLRIPYGTNSRHIVRVVTPGRRFVVPGNHSKSVGGVSFARNFRAEGEALEIEFTLIVIEEVVALDSIKAITDLADEIAENSELTVNISAAVPTLARQLALTKPLDSTTEDSILLARAQIGRKEYIKALTGLNTLVVAHEDATKLRGYLQLLRATVLVQLDRKKAAMEPFEEAFELYEPPTPASYFPYVGILRQEGEDVLAVQLIVRMLERNPSAADRISMDWVASFSRHLRQSDLLAEKDSLLVSIAHAAHEIQADDIDDFRWVFSAAVAVHSRNGDVTAASQYLPYLKDPAVLARLLIDRETEAVWDAIEEEAGADLSGAISSYVSFTKDNIGEASDDFEKLTKHLEALRTAGQYQEAIEFADPIVQNWSQIEAVGKDAYWFVNQYAYTLSDAGYPEKAHSLMSRLISLGVSENGALISMAINRAQLLMHWGDFEASLNAIEEIENLQHNLANDFGWMWIYTAKACSLHQLNRTEEANTVLRESIMPISKENPGAHTKMMLCFDEMDKAADIVIERLNSSKDKKSVMFSFLEVVSPKNMPPFLADLQGRAAELRARPEVRKEFDKVGRVISISGASTYWGYF